MFGFLKHIFRPYFIVLIAAILIGVYYNEIYQKVVEIVNTSESDDVPIKIVAGLKQEKAPILFTKEELSEFNGEKKQAIYLAILGSVYDVSKGLKHYGPGCSYNFFAGRDASVSFITGEFEHYEEEKADDVLSLTPAELLSLDNWKKFYDKDYVYKGKLIGRFFDKNGEKTTYHYRYLAMVDQAKEAKISAELLKDKYPDCNIEWSKESGTRVWCTETSGSGKDRSWVGYPRKLFQLNRDGFRCACVRKEDLNTSEVMIKPYENCDLYSQECFYKVD